MNFTQNEKLNQVTTETLVIGVDIGSETHYARAFDWRGLELGKVFRFVNSREGFEQFHTWTEGLAGKTAKSKLIVGAEPTGHYWFNLASYLKEHHIKLVLVNPYHVKQCKELDDNHPSKTDSKDPKTIAKLVIDGRYNVPYIPEGVYAELRIAMNCRERIVRELVVIQNRIERWLKIHFPEYHEVFADFEAKSSLLVLSSTPLPTDVVKAGADGVNRIWRENKLRAVGMKRAQTLYETAKRSMGCTEGSHAARMELRLLLEDYHTKKAQYDDVMAVVEDLCTQIPAVRKLLAIKGIGLLTVAGFFAEVGDLGRFQSPKQIQKLAGLAIRENSSGKHRGQSGISKRGRQRLRTLLFRAVLPLVATNREFGEIHSYYTNRKDNPLKKKQSIIALCCKLIRVFFALATKDEDYDPVRLLGDIHHPVAAAA
jgi:transposase